jgi:hypothetical protein
MIKYKWFGKGSFFFISVLFSLVKKTITLDPKKILFSRNKKNCICDTQIYLVWIEMEGTNQSYHHLFQWDAAHGGETGEYQVMNSQISKPSSFFLLLFRYFWSFAGYLVGPLRFVSAPSFTKKKKEWRNSIQRTEESGH